MAVPGPLSHIPPIGCHRRMRGRRREREHICRCQRRTTPRIRARLAGPSGLAAALVLGAAGPASASVHRAAVAGPGTGWAPAAAAAIDRDHYRLVARRDRGPRRVWLAGFLLLILGRRKDHDEPPGDPPRRRTSRPSCVAARPAPVAAAGRAVRRAWASAGTRPRRRPVPDGEPSPIWVKRLNDQAPPPARDRPCHGRCLPRLSPGYPRTRGRPGAPRPDRRPGACRRRRPRSRGAAGDADHRRARPGVRSASASSRSAGPTSTASCITGRRARTSSDWFTSVDARVAVPTTLNVGRPRPAPSLAVPWRRGRGECRTTPGRWLPRARLPARR